MSRISQREARRLRKRLDALEAAEEQRRTVWRSEYPGGVFLTGITAQSNIFAMCHTARKLGHAVVVTTDKDCELRFHALPLAVQK